MPTSLSDTDRAAVLARVADANNAFSRDYPGESPDRQPLHTVYGGAQLFKADTARRLGELALKSLDAHAPDFVVFARALGLPGASGIPALEPEELQARHREDPARFREEEPAAWLALAVYERTVAKLLREPVEDFRIDFEDGFGNRPDAEEDATAERCAREVARGMAEGILPPFIGIRVKPLNEELKRRSVRTADLFVTTLLQETGGKLPDGFVITLPKIPVAEQVEAFVDLLELLEDRNGLARGTLKIELMIELTQSILDAEGRSNLPALARAGRGRVTGAHFGTYDYTASCSITAAHQTMAHPACDFAKHMMKVAYAGTGIFLSDGATNVMPVGDSPTVHRAWRLAYDHVRAGLINAFYQGWDLHPAQLPVRYAACYTYFLEGLEAASIRLTNFIEKAAQATLVGDVFDDAATGQGLLNYFLRALNSGAITIDEVLATGLTLEEIQGRSFVKILENRRKL